MKSCILDGEVVAYDPPSGKLLPFQVLSTRSRKVDPAEVDAIKVKVIYCAFDILFLNGEVWHVGGGVCGETCMGGDSLLSAFALS